MQDNQAMDSKKTVYFVLSNCIKNNNNDNNKIINIITILP